MDVRTTTLPPLWQWYQVFLNGMEEKQTHSQIRTYISDTLVTHSRNIHNSAYLFVFMITLWLNMSDYAFNLKCLRPVRQNQF